MPIISKLPKHFIEKGMLKDKSENNKEIMSVFRVYDEIKYALNIHKRKYIDFIFVLFLNIYLFKRGICIEINQTGNLV